MDPDGAPPSEDTDWLLGALDEADTALRALYRQLSENPDLAHDHQAALAESAHVDPCAELKARLNVVIVSRACSASADTAQNDITRPSHLFARSQ